MITLFGLVLISIFLLLYLGILIIYSSFLKSRRIHCCDDCHFCSDDGEVCFNTLGWEPIPLKGYCKSFVLRRLDND
jgi:hypothetical protein